jgi:succinyl-diaminopimelate desuccinylase
MQDHKEKVKIMDLTDLISQMIRFRTETGNKAEIDKCLNFMADFLSDTGANVQICRYKDASPVFFAANTTDSDFDALVLGHIDVVPAKDSMFVPQIKDGKMYGRGTLDMKSFAAVALTSLQYVMSRKLPIRFGVILSTDEETGSRSTKAFLAQNPKMSAKIVLDNDVGGDISKIVLRCKNPVFVKLMAEGEAAHGSTPWDGLDANEKLLQTLQNIRRLYPAFSKDMPKPDNTWIDTMHVAKINGGEVSNIIASHAEALLDFRLTEKSDPSILSKHLDSCLENGVSYQIVSASTPVVMKEDNPHILQYARLAADVLGQEPCFEYIGGATDSREFFVRGSTVIMHSGSGEGMHADGEYVELESVRKIARIQCLFLEKLAQGQTSEKS